MAFISILLTSLLIVIHPTSSAPWPNAPPPPPPNPAQQACKVTKDQKKCEESLKETPTKNAMEIIQTALNISYSTNRIAQSMTQSLYEASVGNLSVITITKNCIDYLENSAYRLTSTIDAFPRHEIKNCRAWTSAALTYQYDCWSELQIVNNEDTDLINDTMTFVNTLVDYTSNALSFLMAYDVYGDQTASWKPLKTERDGFWEGGGGGGGGEPELEIPPWLAKSDVSVCKPDYDQCTYETVQEAVNAAPNWSRGWRFVIYVMKGFYEETVRVGIEKQHVVIVGDGMGRTIIAGSLNVSQPGVYTYNTPTLGESSRVVPENF
ncbi:putative pectinesterase [Helianthus debilis subsp. tardiflorus]